jgi:hypothetical protein
LELGLELGLGLGLESGSVLDADIADTAVSVSGISDTESKWQFQGTFSRMEIRIDEEEMCTKVLTR